MIQAIDDIFKSVLMTSFGLALLHSLWQGLILTIIALIGLTGLRSSKASVRYHFLGLLMMLFLLGFLVTFCSELSSIQVRSTPLVSYNIQSRISEMSNSQIRHNGISPANFFRGMLNFLIAHSDFFLMIWFTGFSFHCVRLFYSLSYARNLIRYRTIAIPANLEAQVACLATRLGIKKMVRVAESGLSKIPVVFGHFKPVILLPLGMFINLSPEQLEAVLFHELAHIRRNDYLINCGLQFIKSVFFFNPFCHWLIALMRQEREHACDDLVLAQTGKKKDLVSALLFFRGQGYQLKIMGTPLLAGNAFLERVSHIVLGKNRTIRIRESFGMICLLVLGILTWLAINQGNSRGKPSWISTLLTQRTKISLAPKSSLAISKVSKVSSGASHDPQSVIMNQLLNKKRQISLDSVKYLHPMDVENQNNDNLRRHLHPQLSQIGKPDTNELKNLRRVDTSGFKLNHDIGQELYREHLLTDTNDMRINLNESELIVNGVRMPQEVYERIYRQFRRRGNYGGSIAQPYENKHPGPYDAFLKERSEEIAAEFVRENLVGDKNHFTYKLSRDELIIDGVRQSDELHRRIVDEYFNPEDNFNLSFICRDPRSHTYNDQKSYSSDANRYNNLDAYYQSLAEEQKRAEDKIDKKLVADLLLDGLITDPKSVSFTLNDKTLMVNGKKQSSEMYKKYKEKYRPGNTSSGWTWNYFNHE